MVEQVDKLNVLKQQANQAENVIRQTRRRQLNNYDKLDAASRPKARATARCLSLGPILLLVLMCGPNLLLAASAVPSQQRPNATVAVVASDESATITTTTTTTESTIADITSTAGDDIFVTTTSTEDTIGVNSDEKLLTTVDTGDNNSESLGDGIEPKSIRGNDNGANVLDATDNNDKSELKIDQTQNEPKSAVSLQSSSFNMSQIESIFEHARKNERETVESWQRLSKKLKKGIGNVIGAIVPMALNMTQEAKISSNCSGAMLKWVLSMNQLKSWAIRMFDASGKPIAGALDGSLTMFGSYRECLKIRAPDDDEIEFAGSFKEYFRGKYCVIEAKPWLPEKSRFYNMNTKFEPLMKSSKEESDSDESNGYDKTIVEELSEWALSFNFVKIRYDLCVPSLCKREDIQKTINYLLKGIDLKARVSRCEMDAKEQNSFSTSVAIESSSTEIAEAHVANGVASKLKIESSQAHTMMIGDYDLESFSQLGWILLPLIVVSLVLISTALSLTWPNANLDEDDNEFTKTNSSKLAKTINSLSLKRSVESHLNVDYDQLADDKPLSLYGVRFLLVLWVILVESAVNLKFEYLRELLLLKDVIFWWPMQFIVNSTLQYDSIILLTAFIMSYKYCLNDGINNARAITKFILDKYVRLMPSIMLMVALVILMPLFYKGPVWNDYVSSQSAICQSTGWVNAVFLQNNLPYSRICLPQTWLLCVEFQLVLLMAPLVYYLNKAYTTNYGSSHLNGSTRKNEKSHSHDSSKIFYWLRTIPGLILLGCIIVGLGVSFYNVYHKELPPAWFYTMADPDSKSAYFGEHMTKIWTHLAVFALGLLAGVECRRAAKNALRMSYKSSNIDYFTRGNNNNYLSRQNKSQSSTSLPVSTQNDVGIMYGSDSGGHLLSAKQGHGGDINNWQSSVSIDINTSNGSSHRQLNGKQLSGGPMGNGLDEQRRDVDQTIGNDDNCRRSLCSILLDVIISLIAITTMLLIIFSTHDWSLNDLPEPYVAGLFDAGTRLLWSLAMVWLLYMISVPNKDRTFSILARSLGHPLMVCLGKLSFLIYIIHPFVHTAILAIQEQPIYSSWLMLFHISIGNTTITVILASLVSLFVEMPCRNLFRRCGTSLLLTQSTIDAGERTTTTTAATSPTATTATNTTDSKNRLDAV